MPDTMWYRSQCMTRQKFEVFVWIKVYTVEVASTIIFIAVVCYAAYWELTRLLGWK